MKKDYFIGVSIMIMAMQVWADKGDTKYDINTPILARQLSKDDNQIELLAKDFFKLINLNSPGLEKVREDINRNKYVEALDAYRDNFIKRASGIKLSKRPSFWLWGYTDPEALLKKGEVGTSHYGDFEVITRYLIGYPGRVNWHKIPESGYDTVLRDLPTMQWASTLAGAYEKSKNPEYLAAWSGYWADFGNNWLNDHRMIMNDPNYKERVFGSIPWASGSILYHGWRLENYFAWLSIAASNSVVDCKKAIDSAELASILKFFAEFEIPHAMRTVQGGGVPNQIVICCDGIMQAVIAMRDFKDADKWNNGVVKVIKNRILGNALSDGSSTEQSFNYNFALIKTLENFIKMAQYPPFQTNKDVWESQFGQIAKYRDRFLSTLMMPDGRIPSIGCGNNLKSSTDKDGRDLPYSRELVIAKYKKPSGPIFTLRERIANQILGDKTLPEPEFTSVYYPYGGYVIMRDGWDLSSHYAFMKTSRPVAEGHFREGGNGLVISAFGKYLLVNSGAKAYSKRGTFNLYFHNTLSQNSVSVDGYSQLLRKPSDDNEVPYTYIKPISARWHNSVNIDFAEGLFRGSYGGYNYLTNRPKEQKGATPIENVCVTGVKHDRQVLFLRNYGMWIVTDILRSEEEHLYSQSWNLHPDFAEEEVLIKNGNGFETRKSEHPNLSIRHFGSGERTCKKYYGIANDSATLGWVAVEKSKGIFTPAVDIHTDWRGKGDQLLVTLIEPTKEMDSQIEKVTDISTDAAKGFQLKLKDDQVIAYLSSLNTTLLDVGEIKANAKALLMVTDSHENINGVALDCSRLSISGQRQNILEKNFEFIMKDGELVVVPIVMPTGFHWVETKERMLPIYE